MKPGRLARELNDPPIPASLYPGDFQDLSLWRSFTRDAVDEIIGQTRERIRLDHFTPMASRDTILGREASRSDDTGDWAAKTVDHVLPELAKRRYAEHIDVETQSPQTIAAEILSRASKP